MAQPDPAQNSDGEITIKDDEWDVRFVEFQDPDTRAEIDVPNHGIAVDRTMAYGDRFQTYTDAIWHIGYEEENAPPILTKA